MFNNVYIIQFDNLPNPKEACQNIQTWMHVQARGKSGGGVRFGLTRLCQLSYIQ